MAQVNVDTVIAGFVKLRDKRAELRRTYVDQDTGLKTQQEKLEGYLLQIMQDAGAEKLGSAHGTAYIQTKARASAEDWSAAWDWMAEHNRLDMLEKRIATKIVQEYAEENGALPPGLRMDQELKVTVRRS